MLLLLVSLAFAQELVKFRGAYLDQPLSDYVDCSGGKAKKLESGYRTHGAICEGKRGIVFHVKTKDFMDPKTGGEILKFEEQKLVEIKILVPNEVWEKVRYDLTQKLGPPCLRSRRFTKMASEQDGSSNKAFGLAAIW